MVEIHWLRPLAFLLFIPAIICVYQLSRRSNHQHSWQKVCEPHLLPHLLASRGKQQQYFSLVLLTIGLCIAIIALAGPSLRRAPVAAYAKQLATVVVLDLSPNMLAKDIAPDRLTRAKFKLRDILEAKKEGQLGLVVFSGEPFLVSPLTDDSETIALMLPQLSPLMMPLAGHNIGEALLMAAKLIEQAHFSHGNILLITASPVSQADSTIAATLSKKGITLSVLAVATAQGAPVPSDAGYRGDTIISQLDESGLKQLATAGLGKYMAFRGDSNDVAALLPELHGENKKMTDLTFEAWHDVGRLLLFLIVPLLLLGFRRNTLESLGL